MQIGQATPIPLASVAEELTAYAVARQAQDILQDEMEEATEEDTLDLFIDLFFEDLDIEFLFDDASDGIDKSVIGQYMGMASLAFDDWFKPFSDESSVHSYVV